MNKSDVSIVVPMYNAAATINECLESLVGQNYSIREIIVVDNRSTDSSVMVVKAFASGRRSPPVRILLQIENKGLIPSYIRGAELAKSPFVVMMHSDSKLPSNVELNKLIKPFKQDAETLVASCPKVCHPERVWRTYNFWQKLMFAPVVGTQPHSLSGKFDCYKKKVFLAISEIWQERYGNTEEAGGEDWDLHSLFREQGTVVYTDAQVDHLHYFSGPFTLKDLIAKRQHIAKSYGKLLRLYAWRLGIKGLMAFLFRPIMAIGSLLPGIQLAAMPLILGYAFFYSRRMFQERTTFLDPRIILVPFVNIFLIYYETWWMTKSYLRRLS